MNELDMNVKNVKNVGNHLRLTKFVTRKVKRDQVQKPRYGFGGLYYIYNPTTLVSYLYFLSSYERKQNNDL